jgi:hypothetical protein
MSSIQIHLNSEDCIRYYGSTSYCEYSLPFFSVPSTSTLIASVVHASIPYSFYNVNSNNNTLCYSINTTVITTVILTPGNYTASSLLSHLQSILPTSFTITYSSTQNKFTFTNPNIFQFYYNKLLGYSSCFGLLGFSSIQQISTGNVSIWTLTSDTIINLAPVRCICIYTTLHTGSIASILPNNQNILCSIPVLTAPFSMIGYRNSSGYKSDLNTSNFNSITLKLTDQAGNLINLNGCHWSLTLQLDVIDYGFD